MRRAQIQHNAMQFITVGANGEQLPQSHIAAVQAAKVSFYLYCNTVNAD